MALTITDQTAASISDGSPNTNAMDISKSQIWTGRILSGLVSAFLLFDGAMKLVKPAVVVKTTLELGYPESSIAGIGLTLVASTLLYLIPQTSLFGAILLTGYLGGAVATHVRVSASAFNVLFPVIFGVIIWGGLWLRHERLRHLLRIG